MMVRQTVSRWLTLGGLILLIALILSPAPSGVRLIIAAPPVWLFVAGLKPPRRWGGWVAVTMIPYLCVALGEAIADPDRSASYAVMVACTLVIFFAAMDHVRKTRTSLR